MATAVSSKFMEKFNRIFHHDKVVKNPVVEQQKQHVESGSSSSSSTSLSSCDGDTAMDTVTLAELAVVDTLGIGGYGRVELVRLVNTDRFFALKVLSKAHLKASKQEKNALAEREILMECRSDFIVKMYRTFRDSKRIYLLMETCMGGELWTYLRDRFNFDDYTAKYYVASVLEAFDYIHQRGIVYRDLKPENVLLDSNGHAKLVDFGCAEKLRPGGNAYSICGTAQYAAPEMILSKGHDRAVDLWSLGIFVYELLEGKPPFNFSNPMETYKELLRGVEKFPWPSHFSKQAVLLIKALCKYESAGRLGYDRKDDVREHGWFEKFDWVQLKNGQMKPPIVPRLTSDGDMRNFDRYPSYDNFPISDEECDWDQEF